MVRYMSSVKRRNDMTFGPWSPVCDIDVVDVIIALDW
jgi:hypothetical protein